MGRPKQYTDKFIEDLGNEMVIWFEEEDNIFIKDFFLSKGLHSQNASEFASVNQKFSDALKRAKEMQESKIAKGGLTGKYNSTFAIFTLKNVAGWRDKQEIEQTGTQDLVIKVVGV